MSLLSDKGYLNKAGYLAGDNYLGDEALNIQQFQVLRVISGGKTKLIQAQRNIVVTPTPRGFQVLRAITKSTSRLFQILRAINNYQVSRKFQTLRVIQNAIKAELFQTKRGKILHTINVEDYYLAGAYLSDTYLGQGIKAWLPIQTMRGINQLRPVKFQIKRIVVATASPRLAQVKRAISYFHPVLFQVALTGQKRALFQVNKILYNTKRLRVLANFPSRGTTGTNWTASNTATGDFSVNNLNTDIVEQCWRSNGSKTATLTCDTQITQGVFVDTIAILGHNLTRSATVEIQCSSSSTFTTYTSIFMPINKTANWYYIAPTAPNIAYRYWRFVISDTTNSAAYLQIGTIVFGSSTILLSNDITDSVKRSTKHFSDKVATEGFTSVSNDRSIKYGLGVDFQSISYNGDDYTNLRSIFDNARTSLKCLWIPTPQYPERFAVFGKLSAIPEEEHNALGPDNDYINFSLEVDESL